MAVARAAAREEDRAASHDLLAVAVGHAEGKALAALRLAVVDDVDGGDAVAVSTTTPAASAASDSAETIDSDESVVGNILPSSSVFNSTPRPRNHAATSGAPNLEKAPSSVREPRGYPSASSLASFVSSWHTLQRPPPLIRTFWSTRGDAS